MLIKKTCTAKLCVGAAYKAYLVVGLVVTVFVMHNTSLFFTSDSKLEAVPTHLKGLKALEKSKSDKKQAESTLFRFHTSRHAFTGKYA